MPNSPHDVAVRWFEEVWNQGRLETVDELATADAQSFGFPQPESVLTREQFKDYLVEFGESFTHIHLSVDETVAEDNRVAVRWTGTMQHTGPGLGFPATGKIVNVHGMSIMHLRDGLIAKGWNALDLGTIVSLLSAISARH